jgi:zinc resistance-associated protein
VLQNLNLSPNWGRPLLLILSIRVLGENMWKPLVFTIAALAIGGSSIVYAQQRDCGGGACFEHHRLSPEERAAFVDARIAALKAGLELTPDQAKNWPMFEQALRDMAQLRAQLRAAREAREQNPTPTTPFERMTRRADNMAKLSAALKHIAEAGTPLYQSLNDAQKERFEKLSRMLRPHHRHMRARNEGGRWRSDRSDSGD